LFYISFICRGGVFWQKRGIYEHALQDMILQYLGHVVCHQSVYTIESYFGVF
jgi:hypothetical protein